MHNGKYALTFRIARPQFCWCPLAPNEAHTVFRDQSKLISFHAAPQPTARTPSVASDFFNQIDSRCDGGVCSERSEPGSFGAGSARQRKRDRPIRDSNIDATDGHVGRRQLVFQNLRPSYQINRSNLCLVGDRQGVAPVSRSRDA